MVDTIRPAVQVDTAVVRKLGAELSHEVQPVLDKALGQLQDTREILHTNFTAVEARLAVAYAAAVEYFEPELTSKRAHLADLASTLDRVAGNWEEADRRSTVQVQE